MPQQAINKQKKDHFSVTSNKIRTTPCRRPLRFTKITSFAEFLDYPFHPRLNRAKPVSFLEKIRQLSGKSHHRFVSVSSKMGNCRLFNLEKHFAFYGAYHSNPINIIIHMIFVWPIFFSALLILYFTPALFNLPQIQFSLLGIDVVLLFNVGFLFALLYGLFYICLDAKAGSLAAFLCGLCWFVSSVVACWLGFSISWKVVLVAQIVCWTGQFIGHGVYEKRAPALLDNLAQAFIMAPFFVLLEALQTFFCYEPYPGFHENVRAKIGAEINEWQEKKQKLLG